MKISVLLGVVCLCLAARADGMATPGRSIVFPKVPRNHWSVLAVQKLERAGIAKGIPQETHANQTFTRYELAVAAARIVDTFGYDPKFAPDTGIDQTDTRWVKDILVALLFEYRDEYMHLGVADPMTIGQWEIEAYQRAKEKHRTLNASEWYLYAKNQPWRKEIIVPQRASIPPHLKITPQPLTKPFK